jgi:hypothetical protein
MNEHEFYELLAQLPDGGHRTKAELLSKVVPRLLGLLGYRESEIHFERLLSLHADVASVSICSIMVLQPR